MGRWKKQVLTDNDGKKLDGFAQDDYLIILNLNKGIGAKLGAEDRHGHIWWFEITYQKTFIGESPSLAGAKKIAKEHHVSNT